MWKRNKYFFIIVFFIVSILIIEYNKPRPVNWFESYSKYDKIPYGNKILFTELPLIFTQDIYTGSENIEESLLNYSSAVNYLFINNEFTAGKDEIVELLDFVANGNNAMIVSRRMDDLLLDTLGLSIKQTISLKIRDSLQFRINANSKNYFFKHRSNFILSSFDLSSDIRYSSLGAISDSLVNFIKMPFGEGFFYLHSNPLVFTNYNMLRHNNHKYISSILSHLPDRAILWDEYYKSRKNAIPKSHLFVIVSTPGLRQAIYLVVIALLVYMLFASKRKQRIIPVAIKRSNDTLNFVRTIGQLYYNENNNKDIGMKRIDFFLSHVRKQYQIFSDRLDDDFCIRLHHVSGVSQNDIKKLVNNFNVIKGVQDVSDERIIEQDKLIESFYKKTRYNG